MASTKSSTVPQLGSVGDEKVFETVVCETPVSAAR